VSAPDCNIHGPDSCSFTLYLGEDSAVYYFHLSPKKEGEIGIIVTVIQEEDWLGSARVHTLACEEILGQVETILISQIMEQTTEETEEIGQLLELLKAHRRTLAHLLNQLALVGGLAYATPQTLNGIEEAREKIRHIKQTLRNWSVDVDDQPNDSAAAT
jgi:hypothetical protein